MKTRNKNGRIQAAFSILDTALCGFNSATSHSRYSCSFGEKLTRWINTVQSFPCDVFARRFLAVWRDALVALHLRCHAPRRRGIQYAAAPRFNHNRLGVLDRPVKPGDDGGGRGNTDDPSTCRELHRYAVCATAARDFGALTIFSSSSDRPVSAASTRPAICASRSSL